LPESSESESETENQDILPPRQRKVPVYLEDYVTYAEAFNVLVNMGNPDTPPTTHAEAMNRVDKEEWKKVMETEIRSMHANNAWILTELPPDRTALKNKWVCRIKRNPDGSIDKYRTRLVVKGCAQRPGIDFDETFSPVTRLDTVRTLLAVAAVEKMVMKQFDVSTAFLYGDLSEDIYMQQPEGYEDGTNRVCLLKRSLYGLKQSSRCWYQKFHDFMIQLKFVQSLEDPCVYIRQKVSSKIIVALYVDDGLCVATNQQELDVFIRELESSFKIVAKELSYFLGLEITKTGDDIAVSQTAFIEKILERFGLSTCNSVSTPMEKLSSPAPGKENVEFPYRSAVGSLLYLARGTRFDIAFAVSVLSRSLEKPTDDDVGRIKRVFRYLAGTKKLGLVYKYEPKTSSLLGCYSDADFAGCLQTYRSTSGIVIKLASAAIIWSSRRQQLVADSTCEAEIIAANAASKDVIWIRRLLEELIGYSDIPVLRGNNEPAEKLTQNPEFHFRTKHIQRKYFFIRDRVKADMLKVDHIESTHQLADIFTKPPTRSRLVLLRNKLGLKPM